MIINIKATNLDLTPAFREYIEEKIGSLDKYLGKLAEDTVLAKVDVARSSRHHKHGEVFHADVVLQIPGGTLYASDENEDARGAIDRVKSKLQREIKKYKDTH